jgi:hypothetical protein
MRKGQVSVFIIIGLGLLIITGMLMYLASSQQSSIFTGGLDIQYHIKDSLEPAKNYIESCLAQVSEEPIKKIGSGGGTLNPVSYTYYYGSKISYLGFTGHGTVANSMLRRQDMETELADEIEARLGNCVNLGIFERQGFAVEHGEPKVNVTITKNKVLLGLYYPLSFSKGNVSMTRSDFNAEISSQLGELYTISEWIVNNEAGVGYFDQASYMQKHTDIIIEKHRPYPDTVYLVKKGDSEFWFALQGESTVMQPGYVISEAEKNVYGCCYNGYDRQCFKSVPRQVCTEKGGNYDPNTECLCEAPAETGKTACAGSECKSCTVKDYSGGSGYLSGLFQNTVKKHGESWCVYESAAGEGYDTVGSRHFLHYCIDGKEYVEECRDYREELCTEDAVSAAPAGTADASAALKKASCRPNRWQDCYRCTTKECCENTQLRDCAWKGWSDIENKCVPYVPPGFRFWEDNGVEVCVSASEIKECEGDTFGCSQEWIDQSAMLCYMQGDCGSYKNTEGRMTYGGYFNTDFRKDPQESAYTAQTQAASGRQASIIMLGTKNREQNPSQQRLAEAGNSFTIIVTSAYSYLDGLSSLSFMDLLNPHAERQNIKIKDAALCSMWQAPAGATDCGRCSADRQRPCTEYKCKSLGQQCNFEYANGTPLCNAPKVLDSTAPEVWFDQAGLSAGYKAEQAKLTVAGRVFEGYKIRPALKPYTIFTISVETSEETVCRAYYTPNLKYVSFQGISFGSQSYSKKHNVTIRVPPRAEAPQKLLDALNLTSLGNLSTGIEKPQELAGLYKTKFSGLLGIYKRIAGKDMSAWLDSTADKMSKALSKASGEMPFYTELSRIILDKFGGGGFYLFIGCTDRAGNMNAKEMFLDLDIDLMLNDTQPPAIVGFMPENKSILAADIDKKEIAVYLNEPAECRYSYVDKNYSVMEKELKCPQGKYALSPYFGGSYECTASVALKNKNEGGENQIYVMCMDNPQTTDLYPIAIEQDSKNHISGGKPTKYINVTPDGRIIVSSNSVSDDTTFFINTSSVMLQLNTEERMNCSYSYNNRSYEFGVCSSENPLDIGQYACKARIELLDADSMLQLDLDLASQPGEGESESAGVQQTMPQGVNITNGVVEIDYAQLLDKKIAVPVETASQENLAEVPMRFRIALDAGYACSYSDANAPSEGADDMPVQEKMGCSEADGRAYCEAPLAGSHYSITCTENFGRKTVNISCERQQQAKMQRNLNNESVIYSLIRSHRLEITDFLPKGESETSNPVLTVRTTPSKNVECGYYKELSLGKIMMVPAGNYTFLAKLRDLPKGSNSYYVECTDEYGNAAEQEISFSVII